MADCIPEFGLIWIDAHMDAHTHATSHTGNIHGMPVAALLGHGDKGLTDIAFAGAKLKPENIVLIGIRCYEAGEADLLEQLGVKIFKMDEVKQIGFAACMDYALQKFAAQNLDYGISLDLDGLDPKYIAATGTAVADGIDLDDLCNSLKSQIAIDKLIGMEIVEYNPTLDDKNFSELAVVKQIMACLQ